MNNHMKSYLDLRAGSNFSLNAFRQEICPNLRIPPKAPNSARTHFSQKIIFVFSKNSLRPFTPESRVFPPESRAIPPEFIFPKNTALQCFRLLKLNSARRQIFCPTPPPGRLVWKGRNCSPFEDPGIYIYVNCLFLKDPVCDSWSHWIPKHSTSAAAFCPHCSSTTYSRRREHRTRSKRQWCPSHTVRSTTGRPGLVEIVRMRFEYPNK